MKARINEHKTWWWAWTFTHGWPRTKFHWHCHRNEFFPLVWHVCVVGFGYSLEIRFQAPVK